MIVLSIRVWNVFKMDKDELDGSWTHLSLGQYLTVDHYPTRLPTPLHKSTRQVANLHLFTSHPILSIFWYEIHK